MDSANHKLGFRAVTGVAAFLPAAYRRPMTGDQRQRQGGSRATYLAMQALHVIFFIAGTFLVIAVSIRYAQTVASLESYGAPIDGDVRRGPFIAIAASLVTAVLGVPHFSCSAMVSAGPAGSVSWSGASYGSPPS